MRCQQLFGIGYGSVLVAGVHGIPGPSDEHRVQGRRGKMDGFQFADEELAGRHVRQPVHTEKQTGPVP